MVTIGELYTKIFDRFEIDDIRWLSERLKKDFIDGYSTHTVLVDEFVSPTPKQVIFNDPATIIIWNDNTKTVVKCQSGDLYDPEKGFVMAYLKRLLGNKNEFNKEINKWVYGKKR
jgi:hypothetical protein